MRKDTTIRISFETKEMLDEIRKNTKLSHNDVIQNLLKINGGSIIHDVENIKRDPVAITLVYGAIDGKNLINQKEYNITFKELQKSKVGEKLSANFRPEDPFYINEEAEILYVDNQSVFVRISEIEKTNEGLNINQNMIHIDLY